MKVGKPAQKFLRETVVNFDGDECLIWPFRRDRHGYGRVSFQGKSALAHRAVCTIVHGTPPTDKHMAAHSCANGPGGCVNPNHLRWATHAENTRDAVEHGSMKRGNEIWNAKLTPADIKKIRAVAGQVPVRDICQEYEISQSHAWKIIHRQSWAWVDA